MRRMTASKTSPPTFVEPWHADVFALTLELSDSGQFSWVEWTATLGLHLQQAAEAGGATDGSDYYDVWLGALEALLAEKKLITPGDLTAMRDDWANAYLKTPHGAPVSLDNRS